MGDLDALCNDMALSAGVTENHAVNVLHTHPHMSLYKNRGRVLDQEKRRREELERQKRKRFNAFKYARQLADCDSSMSCENDVGEDGDFDCEVDNVADDCVEEMSIDSSVSKANGAFKNSMRPNYRNQLMLAEWLLFIGPQFEDEYLMKLCPVGRHVLVVASRGNTKVFTKGGYHLRTFASHLPGGGFIDTQSDRKKNFTVLDCILETPMETTLHVLDVMAWRQTAYYDFDSDYRFNWLENYYKLELEEESDSPIKFEVVPSHSCSKESMIAAFGSPPKWKVDGVLFYHAEAQYVPGPTSLVGWLKPYMMPELFQLELSECYMADMPPDYENYRQDMRKYDETRRQLMDALKSTPSAHQQKPVVALDTFDNENSVPDSMLDDDETGVNTNISCPESPMS